MNTMNILKASVLLIAMSLMISCDELFEFELPEANSLPDLELPMAGFSFTQDVFDFRLYQFVNTSTESTDFVWTFPDGSTSTACLLYTSPSPRDRTRSRMPSSA